jgi:fucose permease
MYNEKQTFAAAGLGMLLFGITMISLGSILPELVARFQVSELAAGALTSVLPLGVLVGSLLFGPVADRYGYKGLLAISALLVFIGLEGLAFAPAWSWVIASTFLAGAGGGALNGATSALVVDISAVNRSARLSLLGVFFGVGALGMPTLIAVLSGFFTLQYIIAGLGAAVLGIVGYLLFIQYPPAKQKREAPFRKGLQLLGEPAIWLLSFILFFESGLEGLTNNWTTSYLQSEAGLATSPALLALTVHVGALTAMRLFLGFLLKRFDPFRVLLLGMISVALGLGLFWASTSYAMVLLALALMGAGFAGVFPITMGRIGDLWPALSGTAFSIALVIALFGNMAFNYGMGILANQYGLGVLPELLLGCLVLLGLALWRVMVLLRTMADAR